MSWFKKSSTKSTFPWKEITSEDQFLKILEDQDKFVLFKHSTRCSISSMAKNRVEGSWDLGEELPIYYLDLIQFRNVSNLIAEKLMVTHQSPQMILVKSGKAVYDASHNGITIESLKSEL